MLATPDPEAVPEWFKVRPNRNRLDPVHRKIVCLWGREFFKVKVTQAQQPFRNADQFWTECMIVFLKETANGAAVGLAVAFPACALD